MILPEAPLLRILAGIAVVYGIVVLLAWAFQDRLLYLPGVPERAVTASPADRGWPYEAVRLSSGEVEIAGWWLPQDDARATLLFFHGNAGNIGHRLDSLALFRELGLAVLIVDYRGFGDSGGRPSERGTRADARAAWEHLTRRRGIAPEEIVVFGRSLGAAVAAELAREVSPAAVILESAFRSLPAMAQDAYPFLPARWLARYEYATADYVREVEAPVLVIHSADDEIIPFAHGRAVYRAASEPKELLRLTGGHNMGFLASRETYLRGIDRFLRERVGL